MRYIKLFENYTLSQDEVIDLYAHFIRILKIHEMHFYQDERIASNRDFREELNSVFQKMIKGVKTRTEDLFNKVEKWEKLLYQDSKIVSEYGCSMWDVCDVIAEDPNTLNINSFIQDFSESDVWSEGSSEKSFGDTSGLISGLDKKLEISDRCEDLVNKAFDIAHEQLEKGNPDAVVGEDYTEVELINLVIEIIKGFIKEHPDLADELDNQIDDLEEYKKRFE